MKFKQFGIKFSEEMIKEIDELRIQFIISDSAVDPNLHRSEFLRYVIRVGMQQIKNNLKK